MNRALSRTARTFLQLVAAGGLTGLVAAIASGLGAWAAAITLAAGVLVTTFCQNLVEGMGSVKPVLEERLPAPPVPPDVSGRR